MEAREVTLSVNSEDVPINEFVQMLMFNVISGILTELKGTDINSAISIVINGENTDITTGGNQIQFKQFVGDFMRNTVIAMASSLKKIEKIDRLEVNIT